MTRIVHPRTLSPAVLKFTAAFALVGASSSLCSVAPAMATETAPPETPITQVCGAMAPDETFCGILNPHTRARTGYYFAYKLTPPCTAGATTATEELEGEDVAVFSEASDLEPNTPYALCLVAINGEGQTVGNEVSIVTPAAPPALLGLLASSISPHDAILEVEIDSYGLATSYEFRLDGPFGVSETASGSIPAGRGKEKVSVDLAELGPPLAPATSFGYSVRATSSAGQAVSPNQFFTTLIEPLPFAVPEIAASTQERGPALTLPPAAVPEQVPSAASLGPFAPTGSNRRVHRLTRGERLRKALRVCDRGPRDARAQCRHRARQRFGRSPRARQELHGEFTFER